MQRVALWGWACRSAGRSSTRTTADCGRARTCPAAPAFNSPCRRSQTLRRDAALVSRLKSADDEETADAADGHLLSIPWQKPPSRKSRQILIPDGIPKSEIRPTRIERRARLVSAIARGRRWLDGIFGVACPVASASNGSAIRRLNGAGNLRRSDSIRNRLQPRPKVPNSGGPKVGITGAVRSNFVLKAQLPGTEFWMQRQSAKIAAEMRERRQRPKSKK